MPAPKTMLASTYQVISLKIVYNFVSDNTFKNLDDVLGQGHWSVVLCLDFTLLLMNRCYD